MHYSHTIRQFFEYRFFTVYQTILASRTAIMPRRKSPKPIKRTVIRQKGKPRVVVIGIGYIVLCVFP